ncbi:unnamed protein product [Peronospora destructor]|uniref:Uncharacterized protein n=1 Tax=Peronospora destructor TaxID=86335 RepID=A0AAV0UY42_9STRA|nr:unnamed protein product [Peronospora destructor]
MWLLLIVDLVQILRRRGIDRVLESQCDQALNLAKQVFREKLDAAIAEKTIRLNQVMRARPLEDVELVSLYETARKAADSELLREDIMSISSLETYSLTLSDYSLEILQAKFADNDAASTLFNKEILQELWDVRVEHVGKDFFRLKEAQLAADIASTQYSLRSIESKVRVAQEMLTQQKDTFKRAVQSIAERITSERNALLDDIQSKESQIDRTRLQVEQLRTLHQEVLDRLDAQIQEAKDERNQLVAAVHSAEVCREKERQEAQQQLLQSEDKFHNEEKTLKFFTSY